MFELFTIVILQLITNNKPQQLKHFRIDTVKLSRLADFVVSSLLNRCNSFSLVALNEMQNPA